jgi:hypothetical protein
MGQFDYFRDVGPVAVKGTISILTNKKEILDELAVRHGFVKKEEQLLTSGGQEYILLTYIPPKNPKKD